MDRRSFIKLTAISGTSATLASCGSPETQLIRFIPDEDLVPGVAEWKPSVCPLCSAGCGLHVRVMQADVEVVRNAQAGVVKMGVAKKLEGNPAHPISQGKLCPRGQAGIQVTYHPDRIATPLKRTGTRGSGAFTAVSWDDGIGELIGKLDALSSAGDQRALGFWTRPRRTQRQALVSQFLARFGAPPAVVYELFGDDVLRRANLVSFGHEQLPTYDLARSRYVISFGADFLGTWNSPVAHNVAYGVMRQGRPGVRGKFVQIEPRMSQTGGNADEWIAIKPGTEGVLALGLAHVILQQNLRPATAAAQAGTAIEGWSGGLTAYAPADVEKQTGVPAARIERIARELVELGPAVAIVGGAPLACTNGLSQALAVNALNALVGSVEQPGGIFFTPPVPFPATGRGTDAEPPASLQKIAADVLAAERSPVQVLLVDEVNPVFAAPTAWRVREAIEKIPYVVSFGSFIDETSVLADLILPDHSFLESWVDSAPESGALVPVAGVAPPAMKPILQTRSTPDVLLDISRRLQKPITPAFPWQTSEEMLQATFDALPKPTPDASDTWSAVQTQGGWWLQEATQESSRVSRPGGLSAGPYAMRPAQFDGADNEFPYHFLPYPSAAFLDGSLAHLPWLQEFPDPLTSGMWSSWVEIHPRTAAMFSIEQGDIVAITSSRGTVQAPAFLSPGIAPDVIAMPVGQGHRVFTRYASGRGENPIAILAPLVEAETGALAWAATRVKIARAAAADRRLILFAGELRERPFGEER